MTAGEDGGISVSADAQSARGEGKGLRGALVSALPRMVLVALLAMGAAFLVLMVLPREETARAALRIDPADIAEARAALTGPDMLGALVEREGLAGHPGFGGDAEAARAALAGRIALEEGGDGGVLSVTVTAPGSGLAARLANGLVERYAASATPAVAREGTGALRAGIERLRGEIAEAEAAIAAHRAAPALNALAERQFESLTAQLAAARERRSAALARAGMVRELLASGRAPDSVPDMEPSGRMRALADERARLEAERLQLSATLLPNHPTMRDNAAELAEIEAQLRAEAGQAARALEAEAEAAAGLEAALRAELDALLASRPEAEPGALEALLERRAAAGAGLDAALAAYEAALTRPDPAEGPRIVMLAAPGGGLPDMARAAPVLALAGLAALAGQAALLAFGARRRKVEAPVAAPPVEEPMRAPPAAGGGEKPAAVAGAGLEDHRRLAADLALGRCRIVLLAGREDARAPEVLADALVEDMQRRGLSTAFIDAGSRRPGAELGIADLSVETAGFGEIVHKSPDQTYAEVPWGQGEAFDLDSGRPLTLIEALSDIYEVVLVSTGRLGEGSTLRAFADAGDRVVVVAGTDMGSEEMDRLRRELSAAGHGWTDFVRTPDRTGARAGGPAATSSR